jgi:hypothetical protein
MVYGYVRARRGATALHGVRVFVRPDAVQVQTDTRGSYRLEYLAASADSVRFSLIGFREFAVQLDPTAKSTRADVELAETACGE